MSTGTINEPRGLGLIPMVIEQSGRGERALEPGAVVVLQEEGARDLAHAGLALVRADEGEEILA